ncbi:unnamed protein product [Paramecium primaurelia]|uniref:RBR-type E3 ubiquitin transferase n=1 Tax=Paramecium primaurelia TaxID=5886 RepID=A0A8S1LDL2_PARPR|nr:unnamed protein product [Paramecium primaurelia]
MDDKNSCQICLSKYSIDDLHLFPICQHVYCKLCLKTTYEQSIREQKVQLKFYACPLCNTQIVDNKWIQNVVSQDLYSQYCELLIKQNLIEYLVDDEILVGCKNQQCSYQFMIWKHADNQKCPVCKQQHCRKCNNDHQIGISCEQGQNLREVSYIEKKKKLHISRCPKCKVLVEKIAGCNFMTCKCGTYFCYQCDQQLQKEDHHKHFQQNKCITLLNGKQINPIVKEQKKFRIISVFDYIPCFFCQGVTEPLIEKLIYQCNSEKCKGLCFCTQCLCQLRKDDIPYHLESLNCLQK